MLAAGGTGGHVYPAIAVAEALVTKGHPVDSVRFAIDARPATSEAVERSGFAYDVLPLDAGFRRGAVLANIGVASAALRSTFLAVKLVRRYRPSVVLGFGAYASVPLVLAARCARIPVVVHEQNAQPGLANRIAVRLGARAATSLPDTALRGAVLTGNPVRPDIVALHREPSQPPIVGFFGGSLGSALLNDVALDLRDEWRMRDDIAIDHVAGPRYIEECRARIVTHPDDRLRYRLVGYEHDMPALYARSTLMVTRSGGGVAELAAAGLPSILVPWDGSAGAHQAANARAFAAAGAAVVITERECNATRLAAEIDALLADPTRLASMAAAARTLARPGAADAVAALAEALAR